MTRPTVGERRFSAEVSSAVRLALILLVLCGVIYPLAVVGVGQVVAPHQANGSLITYRGKVVGSSLIGQNVTNPGWFWPRLSATPGFPYNAAFSSGSNYGATNRALMAEVESAVTRLVKADPGLSPRDIPMNLVTSSASGLDPDITPQAALVQVPRVHRISGVPTAVLDAMIARLTEGRALGMYGQARVNVLELNMALLTYERTHRGG